MKEQRKELAMRFKSNGMTKEQARILAENIVISNLYLEKGGKDEKI